MPSHETRALDLLLPFGPSDRGPEIVGEADRTLCAELPRYGYRRIPAQLRSEGITVNHKAVSRIMSERGLQVRPLRRFVRTTNSEHDNPVFPNLARGFVAAGADQLWVADITYIAIARGFVYLAVILDAWSRRVVGYALGCQIDTRLTWQRCTPISARHPPAGLIHHSDRGAQYAAQAYRSELATHGMVGSMGRRGNPYDNGKAESFMKTLKGEEVYLSHYQSFEEVIVRLPHLTRSTIDADCTRHASASDPKSPTLSAPPSAIAKGGDGKLFTQPDNRN